MKWSEQKEEKYLCARKTCRIPIHLWLKRTKKKWVDKKGGKKREKGSKEKEKKERVKFWKYML